MRKINVCGFLIIFSIIILTVGCETAKGLTRGIGVTLAGTTKGIAKDSQGFWQAIFAADEWIKKNLW